MLGLLFQLFISTGHAQGVDPSVLTFVGHGGAPAIAAPAADGKSGPVGEQADDLESSRYVRRPAKQPSPITETAPVQRPHKRKMTRKTASVDDEGSDAPALKAKKSADDKGPGAVENVELKSFLIGGSSEEVENYKNHLDTEDIRRNMIELRGGLTYFSNISLSQYYFRNYQTGGPGGFAGVTTWLSPFLGLSGDYRFSYLNVVREEPGSENARKVSHQWFDLAAKFRRYSSISPSATSFTVNLGYSGYDFQSSAESAYRPRHSTRAMEVSMELTAPSSKKFQWVFGLGIQPLSFHTESAVASNIKSGNGSESGSVWAQVGGEYKMSRESRGFFRFRAQQYRAQFDGTANTTDPVTGTTPSNVSVSNNFLFFDLGFVLGR